MRDFGTRLAAWFHRTRTFPLRHPALAALLLEVALVVYMLRPILWSPLVGDDTAASQLPMWRAYHQIGFWEYFVEDNANMARVNGLFYPVGVFLKNAVFEIFGDRAAYKVLQLAAGVAVWIAIVAFVGVLLRSLSYAAVAGAMVLFLMQFRTAHDPLMRFYVHLPTLVVLFFTSLTLLVMAARSGHRSSRWFLAAAVTAWALGLLTY